MSWVVDLHARGPEKSKTPLLTECLLITSRFQGSTYAQEITVCLLITSVKILVISMLWASYQIRKVAGCACTGNAGNVFPPPRVRDPDMHHGTCGTHVP